MCEIKTNLLSLNLAVFKKSYRHVYLQHSASTKKCCVSTKHKKPVLRGSSHDTFFRVILKPEMSKRKFDDDITNVEVDPPPKISKLFSVDLFRQNVHGSDSIKCIKEFCTLVEGNDIETDLVIKYLDAGGSILELVSLLDVTAQADLATALPVFRAVYIIVLRIQSADPKYATAAKDGVEHLLATYVTAIQSMLTINSSKHRKVVLKMLTAVVTLYQSFGREILNWLSLTPGQITQLLEPGPVRKAFIMFLMAFFLEGNFNLFKPLIEKKGLLSNVLPGLMYDDATTVAVVLSVLREKALTNPNVPKTTKINLFNTQILQSLFGLYDWIGPRGVQKGFKKLKKLLGADAEEKSLVTSELTECLRVLCINRKHGIIFWDKSLGMGSPMNQLVFTALEVLPKPWENSELSELVIEILVNSPDLIKPYFTKLEPFFEPRDSISWVEALHFLSKVIGGLETNSIMTGAAEMLNQTQLQTVVRWLCIPTGIMKCLASATLPDKKIAVRCNAFSILSTILLKLNEFSCWLRVHCQWTEKQQKSLIQPLFKALPSMDNVKQIWRVPGDEQPSETLPAPGEMEIYRAIAEYLLQVALLDSILIENPRKISKLLTKTLDILEDKVKVTVLQMISISDPIFLSPNSTLFEEALRSLLLLSSCKDTRQDSLAAAVRMLLSTGIFDNNLLELDCWIGSWLSVQERSRPSIAEFFVTAIRKCYTEHVEKESALDAFNFEKGKRCSPSSLYFLVLATASTAISNYNKQNKRDMMAFLTDVTFKILHFYGSCEALKQAIITNQQLLFKNVTTYLVDFNPESLTDSEEEKLCSWLLQKDCENFTLSDKLDAYQLSSLFYLSLYHLRHFLLRGDFDEEAQKRVSHCLSNIFEALNPSESEPSISSTQQTLQSFFHNCLSSFLRDQTLLDNFVILNRKNKLARSFTMWLRNLISSLKLGKDRRCVDKSLLLPWKHRFLSQLLVPLKAKKAATASDLKFWMEFLQPTVQELEPLLTSIYSLSESDRFPEGWGEVLVCIMDCIGTKSLCSDLLKQLVDAAHRGIFVDESAEFGDALLIILQNFPLSIFNLKPEFLKAVLSQENLSDSILQAAELYLQLPGKPDELLEIASPLKKKSCNPYTLLYLFDGLLKREGKNCRTIKVTVADDLILFWPTNIFGKDLKSHKMKIEKQLCETLKDLNAVLVKSLRKFIRGKSDRITPNIIYIVRVLLRLLLKDADEQKAIEKCLKGRSPQPCVIKEVIDGMESADVKDWILADYFKIVCNGSLTADTSWILHADTIDSLANSLSSSAVWIEFARSKEFTDFVNMAIRDLSSKSNPDHFRVINTILSAAWKIGEVNDGLATIFHECTSHKEFLNIILTSGLMSEPLIRLILTLIERCPSVMSLGQVPAFLAAYSATLSTCDQLLLQILRQYEKHCGSLSKFEPLFWGPPAVSHYSVRGSVGLSLWRQVTMKTVLELLDVAKMKKTVADFPLMRTLQGGVDSTDSSIYDPAFLLPLFSNLFSPGAVSYCLSFIHQGALSVTVAALSSKDINIRAAAAVVIYRFYSHLQLVQHSKQKPLWLHVLDCLRFGLQDLENKAVPSLVTVFLARAIFEVAEPLGALYSLHNFLLAKPAFNLNNLPEFLPLFFSSDHNHQKHRNWILEVLRDGMRSEIDLNLAVNGPAFKIMVSFFESSLASIESKAIILQVLRKMVQAPNSSRIMLGFGLLSWLRRICHLIPGPLYEPFLQLVADSSRIVQKEQISTRVPLQYRIDILFRHLAVRNIGLPTQQGADLRKLEQIVHCMV